MVIWWALRPRWIPLPLDRDQLFGESASWALKAYPQFAVVLLRLPQEKGPDYLNAFVESGY